MGSTPDNRTMEEFVADLQPLLREIESTLQDKRLAYGTNNLTRFGPMGILIRMNDKMDRLLNRFQSGTDVAGGMDQDSVDDSWRDLVGYALLGWCEHRRNL